MKLICTDVRKCKVDSVKEWVSRKLARKVDFEIREYETVFCQMELYSIHADITEREYDILRLAALKLYALKNWVLHWGV